MNPPVLETLLKRDRLIVVAALSAVTLMAWGYMVHEANAMTVSGVCHCAGMKMSGPDVSAWSIGSIIPLFLMWSEMMVAMMLPSAAPMILTFALVNRKRREQERPFVPAGLFVLGYVVIWTGFSLAAALVQWVLHGSALLSPGMVSTSSLLAGLLLVIAGIFQWTPYKQACLRHCRSPLNFLMTDWREGRGGAWWMGLRHGLYCTGCCWFLMALLFVAGVMNMWWVAIVAAFVLLEKILPKGPLVGKATGILLAAWGVCVLFHVV